MDDLDKKRKLKYILNGHEADSSFPSFKRLIDTIERNNMAAGYLWIGNRIYCIPVSVNRNVVCYWTEDD